MMNAIPHNLIVSPRCHAPTNRKNQLTVECFLQQPQHLIPLLVVRQISCSVSTWERNIVSLARVHAVIDYDGPYCLVALAVHELIGYPTHIAWRLVADHLSENSEADWTSHPVFISFETHEAGLVE